MGNRNERQEAVRDIVRDKRIRTQQAIAAELTARGFDCTQATISRDIEALDLRKTPEGYYVLAEDQHMRRMCADLVTSVARTGNLVVVKSTAGSAPAVAASLDAARFSGVMGSIAGDDTILVIAQSEEDAAAFEAEIAALYSSK